MRQGNEVSIKERGTGQHEVIARPSCLSTHTPKEIKLLKQRHHATIMFRRC